MKIFAARRGALALGLAAGLAALPALAADKDPVAAVVNGSEIHVSQVADFQRSLPPQMAQAPYPMLLDALINNQLLTEAARKDNMQNDADVKRAVRAAEDQIVRKAWMSKKIRAEISEGVMKQHYDVFVANFKPEDEVHARHILVDNEDVAKAVISDLRNGAKFEDLARAKSKDPSAQQTGGDLGYFTKSEMVPQFAEAAFGMKVGEVSPEPIKSQFGWHVIKVEDRRLTSVPNFEDAKPVIREQLAEQAAQQIVADIRTKAKVKRFNPDGSPLADQPAKN